MSHRRLVRTLASVSFSAACFAACTAIASQARAGDPSSAAAADPATDPVATTDAESKSTTPTDTEKTTTDKKPIPAAYDNSDVTEDPGKKYYFIGLRYRGNIVPKFIENIFVDEGATVYSNSIGIEADIRKDGFSLIPALTYTEYGTGDILFHQKNTPDIPGNYSYVNSSLKSVYATADILWSTPLAKNVDFEYGFGVGIGVIFGNLVNNWVYQNDGSATSPAGPYQASNGHHYSPCTAVGNPGTGCNPADHQNAQVNKVGGHVEPSWAGGGSVPNIFPWISLPQLGLRFKPIKQMEARFGVGFSLTGFWFGLSANYGLEHRPETTPAQKTGSGPTLQFN